MNKAKQPKSAHVNKKRTPAFDDIANELWDADAILAALALALQHAGVVAGQERGCTRPAYLAVAAICETLLLVANDLSAAGYEDAESIDAKWRAEIGKHSLRIVRAEATLAAICDCLDGRQGLCFDNESRDPVRVVTRAMRIVERASSGLIIAITELAKEPIAAGAVH